VLREMQERGMRDGKGVPTPLLFFAIRHFTDIVEVPDEARRAMVAFLVEEGGADIWAMVLTKIILWDFPTGTIMEPGDEGYNFLALHSAASMGNKPVLDYFITECGMPVDTCTPESVITPLHLLVLSNREETELLPIVEWLVEEKGADVTLQSKEGKESTPADLAFYAGRARLRHYLQGQETQQAARKEQARKKQEEGERKKAAAAMVALEEMEKAMEELYLELEEEEKAAAAAGGNKKKEGKGTRGGKQRRKK